MGLSSIATCLPSLGMQGGTILLVLTSRTALTKLYLVRGYSGWTNEIEEQEINKNASEAHQ